MPGAFPQGGVSMVKKAYRKPSLRRLGLLRQVTRFSF
jgi:hypothetical protein